FGELRADGAEAGTERALLLIGSGGDLARQSGCNVLLWTGQRYFTGHGPALKSPHGYPNGWIDDALLPEPSVTGRLPGSFGKFA
ncbi:MAG TPA: hypothetical protein PLL18_12815, partial [Flavobacteriales bacterium]|nr:hypothetical protein [Flavobacteriales bacterium]